MESFATPFPVLFDDGETAEPKQMGAIGVHSVLSFKRFQALMSQKINLPASQLTAVFVCRRAVRSRPGRLDPGSLLVARSRPAACGPRSAGPVCVATRARGRARRSRWLRAFRGAERKRSAYRRRAPRATSGRSCRLTRTPTSTSSSTSTTRARSATRTSSSPSRRARKIARVRSLRDPYAAWSPALTWRAQAALAARRRPTLRTTTTTTAWSSRPRRRTRAACCATACQRRPLRCLPRPRPQRSVRRLSASASA